MKRSTLTFVVSASVIVSALTNWAANSSEFEALSKEATRNANTPEGQRYRDPFLNTIDPALRAAMNSCTKTSPNTIDGHPGEIVFVVAADGRVKKVVFSPDVPLAKCVAAKLRAVSKLPKPPHDSYAVAIGVAKHLKGS